VHEEVILRVVSLALNLNHPGQAVDTHIILSVSS
jgi:hypothetical protein